MLRVRKIVALTCDKITRNSTMKNTAPGRAAHGIDLTKTALGLGLALVACMAGAQEIEPRAYSNAPVGLNFLIAAYAHSQGGLATDPSLPLEDAHLKIDSGVLAYVRTLDLWGKLGKFDVILPYSQLSGTALFAGTPAERHVVGMGDPRLRVAINLYGMPAVSMAEFAAQREDLVIGTSVQVSAPGTQYDPNRVVNLGTNRWSIKPDIGFSRAFGAYMLDLTAGVTFFTDNDDFYGGKHLEQAPLYSMQANLSYSFSGGAWAALGATFYTGGQTTLDGVRKDDAMRNSRAGLIVALPVDRHNSIKFNVSRGATTRIGTAFSTLGVAWQYRWAEGF